MVQTPRRMIRSQAGTPEGAGGEPNGLRGAHRSPKRQAGPLVGDVERVALGDVDVLQAENPDRPSEEANPPSPPLEHGPRRPRPQNRQWDAGKADSGADVEKFGGG